MTPNHNHSSESSSTAPGVQPDQIDVQDAASLAEWAKRLNVTKNQISDAVARVGARAADVEMDLKGSRSTTNSDRVEEVAPVTEAPGSAPNR